MIKTRTERKRQAPRRGAWAAAGLLASVGVAFLLYFPGHQSLLALTLASGIGIGSLQARVNALEGKAIRGEQFSEADRTLLHDLYACFAKGARLTVVLRQSGQLMAHYLSRTGEPLHIEPRIFLGSRDVRGQMDRLRQQVSQDLTASSTLSEEYDSGTFHMGQPEIHDSSVGLYYGRIHVRPQIMDDNRLLLHWRAELPWQWPSYESLHEQYGNYHAQCFPLPNARSILQGPSYYLWIDDGLGEYLAQLDLAAPFLAWAGWDEEVEANTMANDPIPPCATNRHLDINLQSWEHLVLLEARE